MAWATDRRRTVFTHETMSQQGWLKKFAGGKSVKYAAAGENIGYGTPRRHALRDIDSNGLALYWSAEETVSLVDDSAASTQYLKFAGLSYTVSASGDQVAYLRGDGHEVLLIAGSIPVTYNDLIMCETSGAGYATSFVPQLRVVKCTYEAVGTIAANTETAWTGPAVEYFNTATYYTGGTCIMNDASGSDAAALTVDADDIDGTLANSTGATAIRFDPLAQTFKCGAQLDDGDILFFNGVARDQTVQPWTVGRAQQSAVLRTSETEYERFLCVLNSS